MRDSYDYVVIGGGSAGAIMAARLSEKPHTTVCLLEAGPTDIDKPEILQLTGWMDLLESQYDWDYPIEPQEKGNSFLRHSRAKVLGGCSSHNSCIAFHPPAEGLNQWESLGLDGWGAQQFLPYVHKVTTGAIQLYPVPPVDPCGGALLEAAANVGIPTVNFNQGDTIKNGAGWLHLNATAEGLRLSSSQGYLHPVAARRKNLTIYTQTRAIRINFSQNTTTATSVDCITDGEHQSHTISARKEIILCAGAIETPKLLMLSGIGPAEHLHQQGITPLIDLAGVGSNLDDHVEGIVMFDAAKPMPTTSTQWWEIGIFTTIDPSSPVPDLMMHYGSVPFDINTIRHGYATTRNGFCLTPNITQGRSRGTVRLASKDYRDKPKVDPRYFTDPEGYDARMMIHGIRLAQKIGKQAALVDWISEELAPGPGCNSDQEILDYILKTHNTVYHPAGTAKMGSENDLLAVLDSSMRVRGAHRLRVVDASAMPYLPAVNPNITIMAMAEKLSSELLQEKQS